MTIKHEASEKKRGRIILYTIVCLCNKTRVAEIQER